MSFIERYKQLCSGTWTDAEIAALNVERLAEVTASRIDTSCYAMYGNTDGAKALVDALRGTITGSGVCKVKGLGICILKDGKIKTETGRELTLEGREMSVTDRQFFPIYDRGLSLDDAFRQFIVDLHHAPQEERIAFYASKVRDTVAGWNFWNVVLRFHRWTANEDGSDYGSNVCYSMYPDRDVKVATGSKGNHPPTNLSTGTFEIVEPDFSMIGPKFFAYWKEIFNG